MDSFGLQIFFKHSIYEKHNFLLTVIPYPGAIFVRVILFSSLRVEIRKFFGKFDIKL